MKAAFYGRQRSLVHVHGLTSRNKFMAVPALPVTNGVSYKVKLGKSFSDRNNNAFHTISCKVPTLCILINWCNTTDDFKPMSVDYSKPARMRVSEDEVIVSVPNVQVCLIWYR